MTQHSWILTAEQLAQQIRFRVVCPECHKAFIPVMQDIYTIPGDTESSIHISACASGGIYSVEVICPHCKHTEEVKT